MTDETIALTSKDVLFQLRILHQEICTSDGGECEMMALVRKGGDEIALLRRALREIINGDYTAPEGMKRIAKEALGNKPTSHETECSHDGYRKCWKCGAEIERPQSETARETDDLRQSQEQVRHLERRIRELTEKLNCMKLDRAAQETRWQAGCPVHGECPICKAERTLGDPRIGVSLRAKCAHGATDDEVCPECLGVPSDNPNDEVAEFANPALKASEQHDMSGPDHPRQHAVMDIRSPAGTRVQYMDCNGYPGDVPHCRQAGLIKDQIYEVVEIDVYESSSTIRLRGFDGWRFNSVCFCNALNGGEQA